MTTIYFNLALLAATIINLATAILGWRTRKRLVKTIGELRAARDRFYALVDAGKVDGYTSSRRIVEAAITTPRLRVKSNDDVPTLACGTCVNFEPNGTRYGGTCTGSSQWKGMTLSSLKDDGNEACHTSSNSNAHP